MSTPEEDQTKTWLPETPDTPEGEPAPGDAVLDGDAEVVPPAEAAAPDPDAPAPDAPADPEPDPEPVVDAADEASVDENTAAAFAAAGGPPPGDDAPPPWADRLSTSGEALTERPEVLVGAAFAGGVLFALILKRLAR